MTLPDIILNVAVFVGIPVFMIYLARLSDKADKRRYEEDIASGRIRIISHAEYNRSFGIENKLKVVPNNESNVVQLFPEKKQDG